MNNYDFTPTNIGKIFVFCEI